MPTIFKYRGWRFHFYSFEGTPREPIHVHVAKPGRDAKIWICPEIRLAYNKGLTAQEIRLIFDKVVESADEIVEAWNGFFARTDQG